MDGCPFARTELGGGLIERAQQGSKLPTDLVEGALGRNEMHATPISGVTLSFEVPGPLETVDEFGRGGGSDAQALAEPAGPHRGRRGRQVGHRRELAVTEVHAPTQGDFGVAHRGLQETKGAGLRLDRPPSRALAFVAHGASVVDVVRKLKYLGSEGDSMSVDARQQSRTVTQGTTIAPLVMLFFAVGQFVSTAFSSLFGGAFTTADRAGEPLIVPAGYTFSIWGVIEVFSLGFAVWALWWRHREPDLVGRLSVPLAVVFAGFSAWLIAAEIEPNWATLAVFIVMLIALLKTMSIALAERAQIAAWPRLGRVLFWVLLGLYLGWSTAAIWLNLTTALAGSGAPITGPVGIGAQLAILAAIVGSAVVLVVWTRGLLPYAAAVCWALIGAILGAQGAGEPGLALAAGVGLGLVAVITLVMMTRPDRAPLG